MDKYSSGLTLVMGVLTGWISGRKNPTGQGRQGEPRAGLQTRHGMAPRTRQGRGARNDLIAVMASAIAATYEAEHLGGLRAQGAPCKLGWRSAENARTQVVTGDCATRRQLNWDALFWRDGISRQPIADNRLRHSELFSKLGRAATNRNRFFDSAHASHSTPCEVKTQHGVKRCVNVAFIVLACH